MLIGQSGHLTATTLRKCSEKHSLLAIIFQFSIPQHEEIPQIGSTDHGSCIKNSPCHQTRPSSLNFKEVSGASTPLRTVDGQVHAVPVFHKAKPPQEPAGSPMEVSQWDVSYLKLNSMHQERESQNHTTLLQDLMYINIHGPEIHC